VDRQCASRMDRGEFHLDPRDAVQGPVLADANGHRRARPHGLGRESDRAFQSIRELSPAQEPDALTVACNNLLNTQPPANGVISPSAGIDLGSYGEWAIGRLSPQGGEEILSRSQAGRFQPADLLPVGLREGQHGHQSGGGEGLCEPLERKFPPLQSRQDFRQGFAM